MLNKLTFNKILLLFFTFIVAIIAARILISKSGLYVFLIWNIFLAFIPYWMSSYLVNFKGSKFQQVLLFASWLLFFPNALYIVTDLMHLQIDRAMPIWFDVILLFSSAILGLILAFASLLKIEKFLASKFTVTKINFIIPTLLFLGSFGVYLGRFLRWNSWDIIKNPLALLSTIGERFIFPWEHLRTWGITVMLTGLFYLMFLVFRRQDGFKPSDA